MSRRTPSSPWRTMALQASFNRRGMQRGGWWFALAPWLRGLDHEARRAWFARERAVFNTNPYLAPVLLGVRCRIEEDHSPDLAERVDATLQRTFGALGDALFWRAVRPVWFLGTALAGIAFGPVAVLISWLVFAGGVFLVHWRGLAWGYRHGVDAIDRLGVARLHAIAHAGRRSAAVLAGTLGVGALALTVIAGGESLALLAAGISIALGVALTRLKRGPEWTLLAIMAGMILFARWTGIFPEAVVTWR